MNIMFLSSTLFGYRCLAEAILPIKSIKVSCILTTSRQIDISYSDNPIHIQTHFDFRHLEDEYGCNVIELSGKITSDQYLKHLEFHKPDLLVALGWYYMIPKKVRDKAPLGCVGIHASLLPKYRGGAPIPWAIINGEKETGVSLFYFEDGVDCGDIISQKSISIEAADNCKTVYEKATEVSIEILKNYLPKISDGSAPRVPQDEKLATYFPQRAPEDGEIDWSWSSERIRNFIRAQTKPYPGAFTVIRGKKIIIWDADIIDN